MVSEFHLPLERRSRAQSGKRGKATSRSNFHRHTIHERLSDSVGPERSTTGISTTAERSERCPAQGLLVAPRLRESPAQRSRVDASSAVDVGSDSSSERRQTSSKVRHARGVEFEAFR